MAFSGRWRAGLVAALITAQLVGAVIYAFADAGSTGIRMGSEAIAEYRVGDTHYRLDDHDPRKLDAVTFDVDETLDPGTTVKIRLSPTGAWYSCSYRTRRAVCDTTAPQAFVAEVTELSVVIAR